MQVAVRDIYGGSKALDVTLIVEEKKTTPAGIDLCYTEGGVTAPGFAQDTLYLIGTLKYVKFHMPCPTVKNEMVSCESLLAIIAEDVSNSQEISPLPKYMELDQGNR